MGVISVLFAFLLFSIAKFDKNILFLLFNISFIMFNYVKKSKKRQKSAVNGEKWIINRCYLLKIKKTT